jgi:hypothetical protein
MQTRLFNVFSRPGQKNGIKALPVASNSLKGGCMEKIIQTRKRMIALLLVAVFLFPCSEVLAQPHHASPGRSHNPKDYRWHDGYWWVGDVVAALTAGTIIATLPPRREIVYVEKVPYYYDGAYYYRRCPGGYVIVESPVAFAHPVPAGLNTITINVPNSDGSFTPVMLTRYNNGYLGSQGEYYDGHPTIAQLKALYGR